MALIKHIPTVSGTMSAITPTSVVHGNSFSFDLPNVKLGSKVVIYIVPFSTVQSSVSVSGATVDVNEWPSNKYSAFLIVTPTTTTVSVTGTKADTADFTKLDCYEIS